MTVNLSLSCLSEHFMNHIWFSKSN